MKWTMIQPLQMRWDVPPLDHPWNNHADVRLCLLLRANAFHIEDPEIDMTSDCYMLSSFDISLFEKELEFVKKIKSMGKKLMLGFSQDLRFLIGVNLMTQSSLLYTELCKYADVILSGVADNLKIYGRYQDKVIQFGLPFERLNFSSISYDQRHIDLLVSGPIGEECFPFTMELLYLIRERHPDIKIVYSLDKVAQEWRYAPHENIVDFVPGGLINYLPYTKVYLSPELRPRPGRSLIESFYCRTPFISSDMTYHSRLFPEYTFNRMSLVDIADLYDKALEMNYTQTIKKAEELAEFDYWDNFEPRLMKKLFE